MTTFSLIQSPLPCRTVLRDPRMPTWFVLLVGIFSQAALAAEPVQLETIPQLLKSAVGVTRKGTPIECWIHRDDLDFTTRKTRILLIGGLAGEGHSVDRVRSALQWFYTSQAAASWRDRFIVSAIPSGNPDGVVGGTGPGNGVGGDPTRGYPPPKDGFYNSPKNPEAAYLWRWIGMHAPDLAIDVRGEPSSAGTDVTPASQGMRQLLDRLQLSGAGSAADELSVQLNQAAPSNTGFVNALKLAAKDQEFLIPVLSALTDIQGDQISPARKEIRTRLERTPLQVCDELSRHYGHALPDVAYIPAVAMIGRLRYGELTGDEKQRTDVERIVAPYVARQVIPKLANGSNQSGHLIFCELADRSTGERRERYVELARAAADLAFDADQKPREAMPSHLEMSDALFMGGPILAHVGAVTGEKRYFDACIGHLRFMRGHCLRSDGLYRHSPLDEAAWGRGNGFPALGVAWCLTKFPQDHPGHAELLEWYRAHMKALVAHQDPTGCWHQVIDRPESYRELTATCMIGFALQRGVREGWLNRPTYQPVIERAWYAVRTRVDRTGGLVDVCTGTGKQKSLRDYYDRPAILGPDDRGGAMALLFATEVAINTTK